MNPELSNRQYFIKNSSLCNLPLNFFNFLYDISIIKTKSRQSRAISLNQRQVLYLIFYIYCNSIVIPVLSNFFASVDLPAPAGPHIKITLLFDKLSTVFFIDITFTIPILLSSSLYFIAYRKDIIFYETCRLGTAS